MLEDFGVTFHADVITGALCVDVERLTEEQVEAMQRASLLYYSYSRISNTHGYGTRAFSRDYGQVRTSDLRWPPRLPQRDTPMEAYQPVTWRSYTGATMVRRYL